MSRIGNMPIEIPDGVEVKLDGNKVSVKGPKGSMDKELHGEMDIRLEENAVIVERPSESKRHKALHGLTRSLIQNMIEGVTKGFKRVLEIHGVGYRAAKQGNKLVLNLGFSHPVEIPQPKGLEIEVPENNKIVIKGVNKEKVGNFAAKIREIRKPEPYKGKGIRYQDEYVRRKEGKTGA